MRAATIIMAVAVVLMLATPLGCGSPANGSNSTSSAGSSGTGASGTGRGSSTGMSNAGATTGGSGTGGGSGTTGGGIAGLGKSCTYDAITGADTCTGFGLECTSLISWVFCEGLDYPCPPDASILGGPGTCALPQEIGPCEQSIGCQDGGPTSSGESDDFICAGDKTDGYACFYQCSESSDCANITETCQTLGGSKVCTYNYCDTQGGPYFNACDDLGSGDGECLSWGGLTSTGDAAAAVCYQNGAVVDGAACQTYRTGGSGDSQCVFGEFCVPSPSNQTVGICLPLADAPGLHTMHPCADASNLVWVDVLGANFGVCVPPCPDDGGACPENLTCRSIPGVGKGCVP